MQTALANTSLLFFRVAISSIMLFAHGLGKFEKLYSGEEIKFFNFIGIGMDLSLTLSVLAEFFASILILLGLFNRIGSILLIINMSVAVFIVHASDPFGTKEKAVLFLISFIFLFLTGPGKYSLQTLINRKVNKLSGFKKFIFQ